jgi:hypothetical protein
MPTFDAITLPLPGLPTGLGNWARNGIESPLPGGSGLGIVYRMRAYDNTLAVPVYWNATVIDAIGTQYSGPGPLVDIVVSNIIPAP